MELTEKQYEFILGSILRYRTTISAKCRVYNNEDQNRIMKLNSELKLNIQLPKCNNCNGLIYAIALFEQVNQLVEKYESQNKNV
jgi:hypothetical protein